MDFYLYEECMQYQAGFEELLKERGYACKSGIEVRVETAEDNKITATYEKGHAIVKAREKAFVFRGLMSLVRELEKSGETEAIYLEETAYLDKNGAMLDCSRNSVLTVAAVKKFIRRFASLGMNTLMLYTEDTYEVPEYAYFGAFRGRYSKEELKECDDYAELFGIEVVPCIQALAHLRTLLRWPVMSEMGDNDDILMVGEEKVYQFIRTCIVNAMKPFRTKRIHLGMDEAYSLGLGKYLLKNGYQTKAEIMTRHLERIMDICRELQLNPMIWSDMYFRMNSVHSEYYDLPLDMDLTGASKPPKEISLVYWDYYHKEEDFYRSYLRMHKELCDNVIFAGGGWTWNGLAPNFKTAYDTTNAAMAACKKAGIKEAICTLWQDDGAETPICAGLPSIVLFAEHGFYNTVSEEQVKEQFEFLTGSSYEAYMLLSRFDDVAGSQVGDNPSKFLFYQDVLMGLFDGQVKELNMGRHYQELKQALTSAKGAGSDEVLLMYESLAEVLSVKAELGIRLQQAYAAGDRNELITLSEQALPDCIASVKKFKDLRMKVWDGESKIFGYEVLDIRFSGLIARMESAKKRLQEYLNGTLDSLPELEQPRPVFRPLIEGEERKVCSCNAWKHIVSASTI